MPASLMFLLLAWGAITSVLLVLVVYRAVLASKEDDRLYLNKAESAMMGSEQLVMIGKMQRLTKPIMVLSIISGALLAGSAGLWLWIGLTSS